MTSSSNSMAQLSARFTGIGTQNRCPTKLARCNADRSFSFVHLGRFHTSRRSCHTARNACHGDRKSCFPHLNSCLGGRMQCTGHRKSCTDCPKVVYRAAKALYKSSESHVFWPESHVTGTECTVQVVRKSCQGHRKFGLIAPFPCPLARKSRQIRTHARLAQVN